MNQYYVAGVPFSGDELYHYGILGQKWGVRRYQNSDGTLTPAGRERYGGSPKGAQHDLNRLDKERAYLVGETSKALSRLKRSSQKLEKYSNKKGFDPESDYGSDRKYNRLRAKKAQREDEARQTVKNYGDIQKQAQNLVENIRGLGMDITETPTFRNTVRAGERYTRRLVAMSVATGMAFVNPVGIGVGYAGPTHTYTRGTKYKVQNPNSNKTNVYWTREGLRPVAIFDRGR